jgi:hypothetical protein
VTEAARIRRHPELGIDDRQQVDAILDEGFVCHVAYVLEERPVVIPTLYVRDHDSILLHGSPASGIVMAVRRDSPLSVAVTLVDGVVVARSGFQSSINYRSVVIHGHGSVLRDAEHERALDLLVEGLIPGRLADVRRPTQKELRKTSVVSLPIDVLSAKVSTGQPEDEVFDLGTGVWAGVVPVTVSFGEPVPSPDLEPGLPTPDYLTAFRRS